MPDLFDLWLAGTAGAIDVEQRAVRAWQRIQRKPSSLTFVRPSTSGTVTQTVRLEYPPAGSNQDAPGGLVAVNSVMFFGVRDHPDAAVLDTNLERGDVVVVDDKFYTVIMVNTYPGAVVGTGVIHE